MSDNKSDQETDDVPVFDVDGVDVDSSNIGNKKPVGRQIEDVDIELVQRVIDRDEKAFEELYNKHYSMVYFMVKKVMSERLPATYWFNKNNEECHSDFSDVAQEAFTTMWNKIDQFTPEMSTFRVWLSAVARNQALNSSGKIMRHNNYFTEGEAIIDSARVENIDWVDFIYKGADEVDSYGADPIKQILRDEWQETAQARIRLAQGKLTNETQYKLIDALIDEIDQNEPQSNGRQEKRTKFVASGGYERLGELMGITPKAAKSALFRAKKTMQEELVRISGESESYTDIEPEI